MAHKLGVAAVAAKKQILLVEDEVKLVASLADKLRAEGCRAWMASASAA